jgi:hypothetical protein
MTAIEGSSLVPNEIEAPLLAHHSVLLLCAMELGIYLGAHIVLEIENQKTLDLVSHLFN